MGIGSKSILKNKCKDMDNYNNMQRKTIDNVVNTALYKLSQSKIKYSVKDTINENGERHYLYITYFDFSDIPTLADFAYLYYIGQHKDNGLPYYGSGDAIFGMKWLLNRLGTFRHDRRSKLQTLTDRLDKVNINLFNYLEDYANTNINKEKWFQKHVRTEIFAYLPDKAGLLTAESIIVNPDDPHSLNDVRGGYENPHKKSQHDCYSIDLTVTRNYSYNFNRLAKHHFDTQHSIELSQRVWQYIRKNKLKVFNVELRLAKMYDAEHDAPVQFTDNKSSVVVTDLSAKELKRHIHLSIDKNEVVIDDDDSAVMNAHIGMFNRAISKLNEHISEVQDNIERQMNDQIIAEREKIRREKLLRKKLLIAKLRNTKLEREKLKREKILKIKLIKEKNLKVLDDWANGVIFPTVKQISKVNKVLLAR